MKYIRDLPFSEYLATDAVSASSMKAYLRSPLHYRHQIETPSEPTPAMQLGTLIHAVVLEPIAARERYAVAPDIDRRTKAGKEAFAEFQAANADRTIVSEEQWDTAHMIRDRLLADLEYRQLFAAGSAIEFSAFGTDPDTGLVIKARADYSVDGLVMDLKSAVDASPHGFARAVATYKYHLQAAHYMHMFNADRFVFIAVEKAPPYAHGIYTLDEASIEQGRIERRRAMDGIAEHRERKVWPGYGVQELSIPAWAFDFDNEEVVV